MDFDSAIPRFESWHPSQPIILIYLRLFGLANPAPRGHSRAVRQGVGVTIPGCCECPVHGSLGVPLIGATLVR